MVSLAARIAATLVVCLAAVFATAVRATEIRIGVIAAAVGAAAPRVGPIAMIGSAGGDHVGTDEVEAIPRAAVAVVRAGRALRLGAVHAVRAALSAGRAARAGALALALRGAECAGGAGHALFAIDAAEPGILGEAEATLAWAILATAIWAVLGHALARVVEAVTIEPVALDTELTATAAVVVVVSWLALPAAIAAAGAARAAGEAATA